MKKVFGVIAILLMFIMGVASIVLIARSSVPVSGKIVFMGDTILLDMFGIWALYDLFFEE